MSTVKTFKCPSCSAPLVFSTALQTLHCDSCNNDFDTKTLSQLEEAEIQTHADSKYDWETYVPRTFDKTDYEKLSNYICPSCSAQITGDSSLGATICPYCSSAAIIKSQFENSFRPDYIIPFKVDKKSAVDMFEAAAAASAFIPDEFKDKKKISEMSGIYVPFWMFDCDCNASVSYRAQQVHYWSDANYNYTKTNHFKLIRSGSIGFANVPVDGSVKADNVYMEALEPYDYNDAVEFNMAYLSGYLADKYDVSADESIARANERVKNSTESAFASTVQGYTSVFPESSSVNFENGKIRYSLLPVWMLSIKYSDKIYKYAINGQTGKVVGEFPVCKKKKWRYFAKIYGISFALVLIAVLLYFYLF